jgi:hypothetical protein
MYKPVIYPDHIEPLVQFVEETPPERIVAETYKKLRSGTSVKEMLLAGALAVIRSSDLPPGHHGGPLHPIAGLHAVHNIAERLTGEFAMIPVVQNVALANKHLHHHSMGPYILAETEPASANDDVEATVEEMQYYLDRGAYHAMDSYYLFFLQKETPMQVLDRLLQVAVPKNQADDHYLLFPTFTWRALEYFGWDYAKYLIRPAVRYVTRPPAARVMLSIDELIEEYGLLTRVLRYKTDESETEAVTALADTIAHCDTFDESPPILAKALADGLSLEGTVEGLSVGGSALFLRSQTGNPMDVHINTGINIRRYLLSQPEISMQTKLRALFTWNTGPEVKSAQYKLAPVLQPEPEKVSALPGRSQEQLLAEMNGLIDSLPIGERRPMTPIATWVASDEVKHAAVLAQQYANCNYDPAPLIDMLAKIACRDSFTEMHAYKHNQATFEEFHATRPSLRWKHLVSAVQAAAISHGRLQQVYDDAAEVIHF